MQVYTEISMMGIKQQLDFIGTVPCATTRSAMPPASSISCEMSEARSVFLLPRPYSSVAPASIKTRSSTPSRRPASNFRTISARHSTRSPIPSALPTPFTQPRPNCISNSAAKPQSGPLSTSSGGYRCSASSASAWCGPSARSSPGNLRPEHTS